MVTKSKIAQAAAQAEDVSSKPVVEDTTFSYVEYMRNMAAQFGVTLPTGREMLAGSIVTMLVGFVGGYAASAIAGYVFIGAVLLTGSMFLAWISMFITLVIGIYMSCIAASRAGAYVANGNLERDVVRAKNWVTGLLGGATTRVTSMVRS